MARKEREAEVTPANYCDWHNICWTHEPERCPSCGGAKTYIEQVDDGCGIWDEMEYTCGACHGTGHIHPRPDGKY